MKGHAPGWQVRCLKCGRAAEAGAVGITRIFAFGTKWTLGWCRACRRPRVLVIERKPEPAPAGAGSARV